MYFPKSAFTVLAREPLIYKLRAGYSCGRATFLSLTFHTGKDFGHEPATRVWMNWRWVGRQREGLARVKAKESARSRHLEMKVPGAFVALWGAEEFTRTEREKRGDPGLSFIWWSFQVRRCFVLLRTTVTETGQVSFNSLLFRFKSVLIYFFKFSR